MHCNLATRTHGGTGAPCLCLYILLYLIIYKFLTNCCITVKTGRLYGLFTQPPTLLLAESYMEGTRKHDEITYNTLMWMKNFHVSLGKYVPLVFRNLELPHCGVKLQPSMLLVLYLGVSHTTNWTSSLERTSRKHGDVVDQAPLKLHNHPSRTPWSVGLSHVLKDGHFPWCLVETFTVRVDIADIDIALRRWRFMEYFLSSRLVEMQMPCCSPRFPKSMYYTSPFPRPQKITKI